MILTRIVWRTRRRGIGYQDPASGVEDHDGVGGVCSFPRSTLQLYTNRFRCRKISDIHKSHLSIIKSDGVLARL